MSTPTAQRPRAARGVVLVHTMVLMVLMAWIASIVLHASLSRQMLTKLSTDSNEARAALSAAQGAITACLANTTTPLITNASNCSAVMPNVSGCLSPQTIGTRPYSYSWCATPICSNFGGGSGGAGISAGCTCKFSVKVCNPDAGSCSPPTNPC